MDLWDTTREQAVTDGQEDGDARRLADESVEQCLDETGQADVQPLAPVDEATCQEPSSGPQENTVDVYYLCTATGKTVRSRRTIDGEADLQSALKAYFAGPTTAERKRGLQASLGDALADAKFDLTDDGGSVHVSFEPGAVEDINSMATGQSQLLIDELRRTISQFDAVQSVTLTVAGDCAAFWRKAEMACTPIEGSH